MLAGCSSTLLSPRHRLRTEVAAAAQIFQPFHSPLPSSMSTQRLDLPTSFNSFQRKDVSRSQAVRPATGLSVEKKPIIEAPKINATCPLKQSLVRPASPARQASKEIKDEFREEARCLKRSGDDIAADESCINRIKRKKDNSFDYEDLHGAPKGMDILSFGLASEGLWVQPGLQIPPCIAGIVGLNPPRVPLSLTCSEEEDRVCFGPSEVILPPPSIVSWVESAVNEVPNLGEKDGEISFRPAKEASGSTFSSVSHSLEPEESGSDHELGNGGPLGNSPGKGTLINSTLLAGDDEDYHQGLERHGFELVSLLVGCVEAISTRNVAAINYFISKLGDSASPRGPSPISRVIAYFTEALALRVARVWPQMFRCTITHDFDRIDGEDAGMAVRVLNQVSPILRFIHFTANEMLLGALEGKDRVHIIDLDIKQGLQWSSLFQSFALRPNPPSHVRITGIGECKQELIETGERLAGVAEALKLPFEYHAVVDRLEDVRLWMLHVKERESVAVSCMFQIHKMIYDGKGGGVLKDLMGLIRSTNPVVMVMAEQEAEHNEVQFERRVCNSLKYYSAVFDSIDSTLPLDSSARIKVEEVFAREIRNVVACEGADRIERHESFRTWRGSLEGSGFRCLGVSEREKLQSQMILKMYGCESYNVEEQKQENNNAALTLKWLDQPIYTVSAWAPDSSSSQQADHSHNLTMSYT